MDDWRQLTWTKCINLQHPPDHNKDSTMGRLADAVNPHRSSPPIPFEELRVEPSKIQPYNTPHYRCLEDQLNDGLANKLYVPFHIAITALQTNRARYIWRQVWDDNTQSMGNRLTLGFDLILHHAYKKGEVIPHWSPNASELGADDWRISMTLDYPEALKG